MADLGGAWDGRHTNWESSGYAWQSSSLARGTGEHNHCHSCGCFCWCVGNELSSYPLAQRICILIFYWQITRHLQFFYKLHLFLFKFNLIIFDIFLPLKLYTFIFKSFPLLRYYFLPYTIKYYRKYYRKRKML